MNNNITLNASMRNNLLSLRNISKQMDKTQLILATGKKVNSAIDNASAYYQARSLSNRAADLTALLDAMGQGIQTIEAATQGLTSGAEFLEQAAAVVSEAASITAVPEKEWFIEQVGENGAVVSTAQELRDAITAGKETICVYGAIDLGDISISGGLELKANQKLVGVGYFGNYDTNVDKFSSITATASTVKNMISITKDNCVISDLSINYTNSVAKGSIAVISINSSFTIETELSNLDMNIEYSDDSSNTSPRTAINILNGAKVNLSESININISGNYGRGISTYGSVCNIKARALVNVVTSGKSCYGITSSTNATFNIEKDSKVLIETSGSSGHGIMTYNSAIFNIDGIVRVSSKDSYGIYSSYTSGNVTKIGSSANIYFDCAMPPIYIDKATANGANVLEIAAGAKLAFVQDGNEKWFKVDEYYNYENSASSAYDITFDNVETILNVENMAAWSLPEIIAEMAESTNGDLSEYSQAIKKY